MACKIEEVVNELRLLAGKVTESNNSTTLKTQRLELINSLVETLLTEKVSVNKQQWEASVEQESGITEEMLQEAGLGTQLELDFSVEGATAQIFAAWKHMVEVQKLEGKALQDELSKLIANMGLEFLDENGEVYNLGAKVLANGYGKMGGAAWEVLTPEKFSSDRKKVTAWKVTLQPEPRKEVEGEVVINRKVELDPNKYLSSKNAITPLTSIPVQLWPTVAKDEFQKFRNTIAQTIKPLDNSFVFGTNKYELHNSPALGILYGNVRTKDGKSTASVSTAVSAAMYMAVMDNVDNSKRKLLPGDRSDKDISEIFGVEEFEVTPAMREFARAGGVLKKSLAADVGKDVLARLGLGKQYEEGVSKDQYEAMVASLGGIALLAAEKDGLLVQAKIDSNVLAEMYAQGERKEVSTTTAFYRMPTGADNRNPSAAVVEKLTTFDEIAKLVPESKTKQKRPRTKPFTEEQIEKSISTVRHDVTGVHEVPSNAKTALRSMINTPYLVEVGRINDFLKVFDSNKDNVLKTLGYVPVEPIGTKLGADGKEVNVYHPSFEKLTYEQRIIQEAINRDIEYSIEHLRDLVAGKTEDFEVYYNFYYTGNGRYMMDSNTVNPQTDKLHRFLLQPKAHKLAHTITKPDRSKGKVEFSVNGKDTSYYVRVALAQAFGVGIDKTTTKDIVDLGNALFSLKPEQLEELEKSILNTGEARITVGTNNSYTVDVTLEAEHLSHTLQAIQFLKDVANTESGSTVTSSLSAEFDSLTSGFANKVQQFPILGENYSMDTYWAKVGILTEDYLTTAEAGKLVTGTEGVNKLLAKAGSAAGFLDSYKTLASKVVTGLAGKAAQLVGRDAAFFNAVSSYLPGASGEVDNAMRSLFKKPFMIFNYSAGIKAISRNMSYDLGTKVLSVLAEGGDKGVELANTLLKNKTIANNNITTAQELIEFVRNNPADKLMVNVQKRKSVDVVKAQKGKPKEIVKLRRAADGVEAVKFYDGTENIFGEVYGELVQDVFMTEFSSFIAIQDLTNSAFKISFRLFENTFNKAIKEKAQVLKDEQGKPLGGTVTEADVKSVLESLWEKFPWIKGPLTEGVGDVIPIFKVDTKTPTAINQHRKAPQATMPQEDGTVRYEKVNLLIKQITEAVNAGSVLPFHYIDGAELGGALNMFVEHLQRHVEDSTEAAASGVLPVHDAVIGPLDKTDLLVWMYNKSMYDVNSSYSLIDALVEMTDRWEDTSELELDIKGIKTTDKGIDTLVSKVAAGKNAEGESITFHELVLEVKSKLKDYQKVITERREVMANTMQKAVVSNMVGTPGGMYQVGSTEPDTSYLETIAKLYKTVEGVEINLVEGEPEVSSGTSGKGSQDAIIALLESAKRCE